MEAIGGETNDDRRLKLAVIAVTSARATGAFASEHWKVSPQRLSEAVREHLAASNQKSESGDVIMPSDAGEAASDQKSESGDVIAPPAPKVEGKSGKARPIINYSDAAKAAAVARVIAGESQRAVAEAIGCSQSALNGWVKKALDGAPVPVSKPRSRKAAVKPAAAVQQAAKPPPKPDHYKTEVTRIERLLAVRTALQEQLKELESLARTRPKDGTGTHAQAPSWHQRVVAYIEQYNPEKAEELGIKANGGRWLLTAMDDLERLGHNCHGKVHAALCAHGYQDLRGHEPPSNRYDWTNKTTEEQNHDP